jgi:hypothetical protein
MRCDESGRGIGVDGYWQGREGVLDVAEVLGKVYLR